MNYLVKWPSLEGTTMYFVVLGRRKNRIEDQNRKDESIVETNFEPIWTSLILISIENTEVG